MDGNSHFRCSSFHSLSPPSTPPYSFQDYRSSQLLTTPRKVTLLTHKEVSFSLSPSSSPFTISLLNIIPLSPALANSDGRFVILSIFYFFPNINPPLSFPQIKFANFLFTSRKKASALSIYFYFQQFFHFYRVRFTHAHPGYAMF